MVADFLQRGDNTDFDVVQLLAALDIDSIHFPSNHGQMIAVIRYHTPYLVNNKDPLILSFVLGTDMPLRSVLGLSTLLSMSTTIDLSRDTLSCSKLNFSFPLILDPPGKCLTDGVSFNNSPNFIQPGVRTNLLAQLQYTSMDGVRPATSNSTPSDNIEVTDIFFDGNVSRTSSYANSELLPRTIPLPNIDIRIREGNLTVRRATVHFLDLTFIS